MMMWLVCVCSGRGACVLLVSTRWCCYEMSFGRCWCWQYESRYDSRCCVLYKRVRRSSSCLEIVDSCFIELLQQGPHLKIMRSTYSFTTSRSLLCECCSCFIPTTTYPTYNAFTSFQDWAAQVCKYIGELSTPMWCHLFTTRVCHYVTLARGRGRSPPS